ncbi:hypothetical protein LB542_16700 [Mesorhizobium sp. BR1-1-9]|uniref:hypothetical protein n=1 Tax=unclassified Mesorhizobium TaxID=325217 RepID=UPI00112E6212|nr:MULTISPECIES: hypothetical protein [unclassified Mesorhizobium]MBZ9807788.1 hypothetical protein [Mesorhizobium sp. ESP-6-2]MBZ9872492.1 hypothetical protein [Mesorhizobium sp. BR1-1-9]MBZ9941884.1 hypothetical protein [Mesorhizobium sp. BR1-1-13]TPM31226.1 hypothetical protein FJ955_09460 [Mesorhizobium sp. B2-2-2]
MDEERLAQALSGLLGEVLTKELCIDFVKVRQDATTLTLERASPGKFVETFVQCLQYMAKGKYDAKPDVDAYLSKTVENETVIPEGLRICASRIARSIYTLRNKRNIAHKNPVDPNRFDLAFVHQGAAWITAELLRNATGVSMEEAGKLIELVQAPLGTLVEEIDGTYLVHADTSVKGEILILLHSRYPERVPSADILKTMSARSAGSVRNRLGELRTEKLVHGDAKTGFRLTQAGYSAAVGEIQALMKAPKS